MPDDSAAPPFAKIYLPMLKELLARRTESEVLVLIYLIGRGAYRWQLRTGAGQIAEAMSMSRSTVQHALRGLRKAGLAKIKAHQFRDSDVRVNLASLKSAHLLRGVDEIRATPSPKPATPVARKSGQGARISGQGARISGQGARISGGTTTESSDSTELSHQVSDHRPVTPRTDFDQSPTGLLASKVHARLQAGKSVADLGLRRLA